MDKLQAGDVIICVTREATGAINEHRNYLHLCRGSEKIKWPGKSEDIIQFTTRSKEQTSALINTVVGLFGLKTELRSRDGMKTTYVLCE